MKQTFVVILMVFICSCSASTEQENSKIITNASDRLMVDDVLVAGNIVFHPIHFDTSNYAILKFSKNSLFSSIKTITLSETEVKQIEKLLNRCIIEYDNNLDNKDFIIDPKDYKAQFIPTIDSNGEKNVWVICFCHDPREDFPGELAKKENSWRDDILLVDDGGTCYFNLKINLTKNKYYNLVVNGIA